MEEQEYNLKESIEGIGKLAPILKDAHGNIIDGFHRKDVDSEWNEVTVDHIDTPAKLELARIATNFCRRKMSSEELKEKLVFLIGKCGLTAEQIAKTTGIGLTTIYKYLPQELKDQKRAEAGKLGGEAKAESFATQAKQTVTTQDTAKPRSFLDELVECEICHMNVHRSRIKDVHGHNVCPQHVEVAERRFKPQPAKPEPKPFKPKETAEFRTAQMHPQKSSFELEVIQELQAEGLQIQTDKEFCVAKTTPDGLLKDGKIAVYIDGPVHEGREDRDAQIRERLEKLHDIHVLPIPYKANTKEEKERVKTEIREALKWE